MAAPRAGQRDPQALIGSSTPRERTPHRRSVDPRAFLRAREIQKRLATGEPVRYAVPVADPRLAVLPAQKHNLVVEQAGEIDQSGLRTIDQAPVRVNPLDQPLTLSNRRGATARSSRCLPSSGLPSGSLAWPAASSISARISRKVPSNSSTTG